MLENSPPLLERLTIAADERQLADNTKAAYTRTWRKLLAWCAAEGFESPTLPQEQARIYYEELTRNRSASHHLQVKAALAFLYKLVDQTNPFLDCQAPRFNAEAIEIHFLEAEHLGKVLRQLHESASDYGGKLTSHLAEALFFTACRFHEWATLTSDKLVRNQGTITAVRLRVKGGKHRDLPILPELSASLHEWRAFLDGIRGVRLRRGALKFASSDLLFPGRDGTPFSNQTFNKRLAAACRAVQAPVITAHGLRHSAASLLLNDRGKNIRQLQELLGHRSLATTARYTHIDRKHLQGVVEGLSLK